jgi:hypothetical protein
MELEQSSAEKRMFLHPRRAKCPNPTKNNALDNLLSIG